MAEFVFKVVFSKKRLPFEMAFFIIDETVLFYIRKEFVSAAIYIMFAAYALLIAFFLASATLLFYVKVKGSNIKVRTRFGRKYEFNASDIEKVICSKRSSVKYGPLFYITVIAKSKELCMECRMVGFNEMAGYILEKYQNGEINKQAISENCQKELYRYKNQEFLEKKKNKRS